jgi:hypothetical protein
MAPTLPPPQLPDINLEPLNYIPKRAVVEALRLNPTQRYVPSILGLVVQCRRGDSMSDG